MKIETRSETRGQTANPVHPGLGPSSLVAALPMPALIIEQDQLALPPEIISAMRDELTAGGVRCGTFYVGAVCRLPETIYFLWRRSGEIPVSMTVPRKSLSHPMLARIAIDEFLLKWDQMIN